MGIKTKITQDDLPLKYKTYALKETQDGITHSVYLLESEYVLKIVEKNTLDTLLAEQNLLKNLEALCVPKLLDIYEKDDCTLAFYTQKAGESVSRIKDVHIEQIATFLKEFHSVSQNLTSINEKIYTRNHLKNLVLQTKEPLFLNYFNDIDCELKNDGVIHGDLFYDNAKFQDDTLSGVYDFIEACEGDFIFELAVVALSWCFENNTLDIKKVQLLLDAYGLSLDIKEFKEYIKYALLYYTTTRYLKNENYKELLQRLQSI